MQGRANEKKHKIATGSKILFIPYHKPRAHKYFIAVYHYPLIIFFLFYHLLDINAYTHLSVIKYPFKWELQFITYYNRNAATNNGIK
jgi:hypothetical protein